MKKIALILPIFGKIPNYFDLWISSAKANNNIDFFIFTDVNINKISLPPNIYLENMSFNELVILFQENLGKELKLNNYYKLCDYKPAYGHIFSEYIKEYDFWGHVDPDVIFGNIRHFITDDILDNYDRIYTRGHLSLYRNIKTINMFYSKNHNYLDIFKFEEVKNSNAIYAYDEWGFNFGFGISELFKREKISQYDQIDFADISPATYNFKLVESSNFPEASYFVYSNGKLFGYSDENYKEFSYIHLQKRKMRVSNDNKDLFYIFPDNFSNNFEVNGKISNFFLFHKNKILRVFRAKLNKINWDYAKMRFSYKGVKGVSND
ncbi:DUF6625 family protein [Enterococcus casseliflavus]